MSSDMKNLQNGSALEERVCVGGEPVRQLRVTSLERGILIETGR